MTVQIDTNILTRLATPTHPHHAVAVKAREMLESAGTTLCIVPQNLYEFWVVATRPVASNGLGLSVEEATIELEKIQAAFLFEPDPTELVNEWKRIVTFYKCQGKPAHDARLVATMNLRGIQRLLTFNVQDFRRFDGLIVIDPTNASVIA